MKLSRRTFLRGVSLTGAVARVGLPPLAAMFNSNGTAYAADATLVKMAAPNPPQRAASATSTRYGISSASPK